MTVIGNADQETDTRAAIMAATYRALCQHGYADLTMQAIADEFDKTKAVLHYHYDTKEELLVAFLAYLIEHFQNAIDIEASDDPGERLVKLVEALLLGTYADDARAHWEFHTALLEVRAQAPHNEAFREQLTTNYRFVHEAVVTTIEDGIEKGIFRDVDPDRAAALLLAAINGARLHQVTLEDEVAETVHTALVEDLLVWLRESACE